MMTLSPSAAATLADLAALGIDVEALGGAIWYRPRQSMTPDLMERLQTHKAELLNVLDTDSALAELQPFVAALWKDHAWRRSWEHHFREAKYANLDSLRRVLGIVIDLAEEHHRRHDGSAFASACQYLHHLASAEERGDAKRIADPSAWIIEPTT